MKNKLNAFCEWQLGLTPYISWYGQIATGITVLMPFVAVLSLFVQLPVVLVWYAWYKSVTVFLVGVAMVSKPKTARDSVFGTAMISLHYLDVAIIAGLLET